MNIVQRAMLVLSITIPIYSYGTNVSLHEIIANFDQVELIEIKEFAHSFIGYVKYKNKIYLVKQKKCDTDCSDQFIRVVRRLAKEVLTAHIADKLNINAHKVAIIPAAVDFPGKKYPNTAATLHTIVPGDMVKENTFYNKLNIKQRKDFNVPQGLTKQVICNMARHRDLAPIVALDTFIGNPDRGKKNIFFSKKLNKFFAIDMASAFKIDLAHKAIPHLRKILQSHEKLSAAQLKALKSYQAVLKLLSQQFPVDTLLYLYTQYRYTAALSDPTSREMELLREVCINTCKSVGCIIDLIERILKK